MGRTVLVAGLTALIPLIGNVVASFLTEWTGALSWLVVPAVAVVGAMITAVIEAYGSAAGPVTEPSTPRGRNGTPLGVALLVALPVVGLGGWAVTEGVRYGVGYITGNESGTDRLAEPALVGKEGLTLTVEGVIYTDHFTRVELVASNETGNSLSLPLTGFCSLVGDDGTTLDADSFKSQWSETLAPGSRQRGTVTFNGHLPDSVTEASLHFSTVFTQGFEGPDSISVPGIRLRRA